MYYLFTNNATPMSTWGHAIMSTDRSAAMRSGRNEYTYDGIGGVKIEDLRSDILAKWDETPAVRNVPPAEAYRVFDPYDILNDAKGYGDLWLLAWLWDHILATKDIISVLTRNGAVVFDDSLLSAKKDEKI